jgi:predicted acetyltransferase
MTQVEIRRIDGAELLEVSHLLRDYSFWPSPPLPQLSDSAGIYTGLTDDIHLALYEDGKALACASFTPLNQHVRSEIVKSGGVWGVATHPAGRRQGYARQLLLALLDIMKQEGMAFSSLYPFRESFYDRLGYTNFPHALKVRFPVAVLTRLLKQDFGGKVELLPLAEGFAEWRAFLARQQVRLPGMVLFTETTANVKLKTEPLWLAIARVNGEVTGMMLYKLKGRSEGMSVSGFYYENSRGLYLLLEWIARHADQAEAVEIKLPAGELPETWVPDLYPQVEWYSPPMGRVVDVSRLNGLQSGPGRFSARIIDRQCPWNEGSYTFESVDGLLQVTPTSQAECELSIQALTGLLYGTHRPESFELRGWGNPDPAVQSTMSGMFPPQLPYMHETF